MPDEIKEAAQQNQPVIHLNLRSASSVITNCIIAYREIHPEVKFRLSQKPDDPVADYFISATGLDTELKLSQRVLFTEEFYLAVPTSSELSHKHSIRLQDTATESYVSLEKTRPVRQICDEFCAAAEFKPNIVYESDSPETVRNLIAAGLGIGFWPQYSWESSFSKHVKLLPIESPVCRRQIIVTVPESKQHNRTIMEFHDFLCGWIKENILFPKITS